jgi:hypothetical protein
MTLFPTVTRLPSYTRLHTLFVLLRFVLYVFSCVLELIPTLSPAFCTNHNFENLQRLRA